VPKKRGRCVLATKKSDKGNNKNERTPKRQNDKKTTKKKRAQSTRKKKITKKKINKKSMKILHKHNGRQEVRTSRETNPGGKGTGAKKAEGNLVEEGGGMKKNIRT